MKRLVKVQTPALRWPRRGETPDLWFGAHNFVAVMDGPHVIGELHGIARGPGGTPLRIYGGVLPFRREVIWGERFDHATGFHDPAFPQGDLIVGDEAVERCLRREAAVREAVNARGIAYPWPAAFGANSNAYYATLIAGMGLADVRLDRQLWAPSSERLLLDRETLDAIAALG
jgi:hypothetical protein